MGSLPSPAIVLVDDEPAMLRILDRLVRNLAAGYDVIGILDGGTALAEAAQRPVALLITDYRMPKMDGMALITALKATVPACPTVLLSGYLTPEVMQQGRAAGVDFYLAKPFLPDQLITLVQMVLEEAGAVAA
jgi:two-component system, response regulator, stage 0 sporulation protein F